MMSYNSKWEFHVVSSNIVTLHILHRTFLVRIQRHIPTCIVVYKTHKLNWIISVASVKRAECRVLLW